MHNFRNHFKEKTVITIRQVKRYPHPAISQWQPLPHPRGNLASFVWKSIPFFSIVLSHKYKSLNSTVSFCLFFTFMQSDQSKNSFKSFFLGESVLYMCLYIIFYLYICIECQFYIHRIDNSNSIYIYIYVYRHIIFCLNSCSIIFF